MNEPMAAGEFASNDENREKIWRFARHFCGYVGRLDPTHPTTVGVAHANSVPRVADVEDVLSFHSYKGTEARYRSEIQSVKKIGREQNKAVVISETGHYQTGQPYSMAIPICSDEGIGWYIWELMIAKSPFAKVQGIFYPDGTVRSAEDCCALAGFAVKPVLEGEVRALAIDPEHLTSELREARCTATDRWNAGRRMELLHSAAVTMPLLVLRIEEDDPGIDGDKLMWEGARDKPELRKRYLAIETEVMAELRPKVGAILEAFRTNQTEDAFSKIDAAIAGICSELRID